MIQSVNRPTGVLLVVSLICVAGIGVTAATIDSANPVGADNTKKIIDPPSPREGTDIGGSTGSGTAGSEGTGSIGSSYSSLTTCVPFVNSTLGTLVVLGSILAISLLVYYRFNAAMALFTGWTVLPPTMLGYFLVTDCGTSGGQLFGSVRSGTLSAPGRGLVGANQIPPWAMVAFAVVMVGGAGFMLYRSSGADEVVQLSEEADTEDVELDQFGAAAGRAAERIEQHNQDVDNAVYRAWVEMTCLLDVNSPETYSAGEFADAAVAVGMDRKDVTELTELFNEVRYGGRDIESREDQAIAVLRNIETQYTDPSNATKTNNDESHDHASTDSIEDEDRTSNEGA